MANTFKQTLAGLSLAQQILQLEDVAPVDLDPEDVQVTGIDPDPDVALATAENSAARTHYFNVGPSSLRKLHDSLSDPKYDGVQTSRKLVLGESNDSESDSPSEDAESDSHISEVQPEARTAIHVTGAKRKVDACTTSEVSTERPGTTKQSSDLSSGLRKAREEDRKKGRAISRQIAGPLGLASRCPHSPTKIRRGRKSPSPGKQPFIFLSRKCLTDEQLSHIADNEQVHTSLMKMLEEARLLSNEIFGFQEHLLSANESIQPPPRKRLKRAENDHPVAGYAEELRQASHEASDLECVYHPHLVQTLDKWSSKIQAVAPSVLLPSNRNAFSRTTQHTKSATELIDETLADHSKVLARTRIYRGKASRLGPGTISEGGLEGKEDPEVFDDTDFYHQLLRAIIDARGNGTGRNNDWMAVQKEKKAKKKVDTKASKGRKLRYEVHEKMQNFMVPVLTQGGWHEEQIDELFASLLGKGFESAMQEVGEVMDEGCT